MENFGDWLYILILIVAGIGSVFSSLNKKHKEASGQQAPPREIIVGDGYDEEPMTGRSQQSIPDRAPQPIPGRTQPQPRPEPFSRSRASTATASASSFGSSYKSKDYSDYLQRRQTEGVSAFAQQPYNDIMPDNVEAPASVTLDDLPANIDGWRKAFVYNEIFNRKY